ncbi:hypothetical protein M413DRAFT_21908 [Hebeloma cylindrosporum]|uniref:G domain-containing protein n=1 Tax=Hebeloma cylindrosporum TaxID=76867 RepID=A0A0C3D0X6_HEBCY|nr:hypothetical protein M413DRAFT_21908 [Hebeloma cylindrosporum h7]
MSYETDAVKPGNLKEDDIIIAIMGPTGCGKSQIIDLLTGQPGRRAKDTLQSVTKDVTAFRVLNHETHGSHIVLVDTPGFDDVDRSDKEILEMISAWLVKTYKRKLVLAGVIYLHRISDLRMSEAPHRNLRMFGELSGNKSAKKVVLATTMWDKVCDIAEGEKRESALKEKYWNVMLHHGAVVERFLNTPESAWAVINKLVERERNKSALLLQEELLDLGKRLNETNAGKALYLDLQILVAKQNKTIQPDVEKPQETEKDMHALLQSADKILREAESLRIPLRRKVARFIGNVIGKK